MPTVEALFADYAAHHKTRGNKLCHFIGIPIIVMSLLGLLAHLQVGPVNGGVLLLLVATAAYLALDWRLGTLMLLIGAALVVVGGALAPLTLVALQVVGWVLQFIGHGVYEKRSPAFFRNLVHLLVGPLWILEQAVRVTRPSDPA